MYGSRRNYFVESLFPTCLVWALSLLDGENCMVFLAYTKTVMYPLNDVKMTSQVHATYLKRCGAVSRIR